MNANIVDTDEIIEAVREWLEGTGVDVTKYKLSREANEKRPFELLVLSLKGVTGSPVEKMAERYGIDNCLLIRWLLPIRRGSSCSVIDLEQRRRYRRLWTFPAVFRMNVFDKARRQRLDNVSAKERVHPLDCCPNLDKGFVRPAWWRDVQIAWEKFAKKIKDLEAAENALTPDDLAMLEARLNAVFVSSKARAGMRCFEEESSGAESNPLRALEDRRTVLVDWPAKTLGRLRIPHKSHRGRLCPFQTPESDRIGLSLHLAADAKISSDGEIAPGKDLLSAAVGFVPYPTHTDGPRLMMGGKNMKQAEVGIRGAEPPIVPGYYEGEGMTRQRRETLRKYADITDNGDCFDENDRFLPSLGLNALTVIMPFKGYTYEDGLVISQSLADRLFLEKGSYAYSKLMKDVVFSKKDLDEMALSSDLAIDKFFEERRDFLKGRRFVYGERLLPNEDGLGLKLYIDEGASVDNDEDGDAGANGKKKRREPKLKEITVDEIYAHHVPGFLEEIDVDFSVIRRDWRGNLHVDLIVAWRFTVPRPMGMGDKLTGRNGNKGVVTKVLPDEDMPYVHFIKDGKEEARPAELLISPSSIMGRKNLGQIWEMTHSLLIELGGEEGLKNKPIDEQENLGWERIQEILGGFGADDRGTFKITWNNGQAFAGWQYFCRLHHHAWKKLQARGGDAPTDAITGQPVTCGAQTGQRMGEMENWSLLSHGALDALMAMREEQTGDFDRTRKLLS